MKAIILTSILTVLSFTNLIAGNPQSRIFNNVDTRENGATKEYVFVGEDSRPEAKSVYEYDSNGALLSKVSYKWNTMSGWEATQKYTYEYNVKGKVSRLIYTQWNKNIQAWSSKSQYLLHTYNSKDELLSVKQLEVNNDDLLIAGK